MVFSKIRNYLSEFRTTQLQEWKLFQKFGAPAPDPTSDHPDEDLRRLLARTRFLPHESELSAEYQQHYKDTYYGYLESDHMKLQPYEFYTPIPLSSVPPDRQPAPGLTLLPYKYHPQQVVTATDIVPETGFKIHPLLEYLLSRKYIQYRHYIDKYCRPLGTTDATFSDFNREQQQYPQIPADLVTRIVIVITQLLNAQPFLPLHYVDTFFAKMPLSTGVSYFYRHSYELKTHAAFSHDPLYRSRQTSKGYMLNAFTEWARTIVHRIKEYALPFSPENLTPSQINDKLREFILEHATLLYTRNHISERDGTLKQRPVYAMDTLFLHLECMITFPLHIMARSIKSSIMYSLETIRGGCAYMDSVAKDFTSFLCIDWSSFDQRMPWIIVDSFFTHFLPSLIVISHGYQPTAEYRDYPGLTPDKMFKRIFNIIIFIRLWYYNCVFLTADGFAYVRQFAGIASGMLNTQYLDSYCNLFLMLHALFHFGCTEAEIMELSVYVMGDDNVMLTHWCENKLFQFMIFFEQHALTHFGMIISTKKSVFTVLRSRIEMLGYRIMFGTPKRDLGKLIAQLCYPEHGPLDKYMSARAVGIAWAAAGMDPMFHEFCFDVYVTFLPYADKEHSSNLDKVLKHLPGFFKILDDPSEFVNPDRFPSIDEVRNRYKRWQGELDPHKKWSPAHFTQDPETVPTNSVTMKDYMSEHNMSFPDVPHLFN
nr:RNA-dependent RNA polymerase [Bipolaris oryzae partitivirus 1]